MKIIRKFFANVILYFILAIIFILLLPFGIICGTLDFYDTMITTMKEKINQSKE